MTERADRAGEVESATVSEVHTFLIADVRGYTRFTVEMGDEAAAGLAARFAAITREVVRERGGEVIELRGDEALAVFSSVRQALRASVGLQERYAAETAATSLPFSVGIGLDAGEAIAVEGGYRGAALNLAARLCSLAGPGEVLVSEGVAHLARKMDDIDYVPRGTAQLKGFSDPIDVIRVLRAGSDRVSAGAPAEHAGDDRQEQQLPIGGFLGSLPSGPLVGREDELGRLLASVDAVAEGTGRLVLLAGEPGIGKTRLAQEVTLNLRNRRFLIASGRCYEPQHSVPFYPFLDVLATAYADEPAAVRAQVPQRWPALGRLLPDAGLPDGEGGGGKEEQQRLFRAVTGFLQAIAGETPVAILLDDLQWVDESSLDLLQHLVRHTRTDRLLILGTYRDIEVTHRHPLDAALRDLTREDLVERVTLRRLDREETAALMAASFDEQDISAGFAELVHWRTEGNPFFVQHVLRELVERGDVFRRDGRWTRKDLDQIEVPETVRSVIAQRLSHLAETTQDILREASVAGQTFDFDMLLELGDRTEDEVETALEEAEGRGLIREAGRDSYAFDHALTQGSLYGDLPGRKRRRLHRAAGEALERLPEHLRRQRAGELAWHFLEGDDVERALPYAIMAGDQAREAFARDEAERHYDTALELARQRGDGAREVEVLERRGKLRLDTFDGKAAVADYEQLLARARQDSDRQRELQALLGLGRGHYLIALDETSADEATRCRAVYEEAYDLARALDDKRAMARALLGTRWLHDFWPDYWERSLAARREALRIAEELGDEDLIVESRLTIWRAEPRAQAEAWSDELEGQLSRRNDLHRLNELYFDMMWAHLNWGTFERTIRAADAGIRLADEIGIPPVQYHTLKALALMGLGRYGDAWQALQREVADGEHPFGHAMQGLGEAVYLLDLLAYDRVIAAVEEVDERARRVQRAWIRRWLLKLLVRALVESGRLDDASVQAIRDRCAAMNVELEVESRVDILLARGEPGQALEEIEPAAAELQALQYRPDYITMLERKAEALLQLQRAAEALATADEALEAARDIGALPLVWRAQATRAQALEALNDGEAATEARAEAAAVVRRLAESVPDDGLRETFVSSAAMFELPAEPIRDAERAP